MGAGGRPMGGELPAAEEVPRTFRPFTGAFHVAGGQVAWRMGGTHGLFSPPWEPERGASGTAGGGRVPMGGALGREALTTRRTTGAHRITGWRRKQKVLGNPGFVLRNECLCV